MDTQLIKKAAHSGFFSNDQHSYGVLIRWSTASWNSFARA
jgi:hypothetical protein